MRGAAGHKRERDHRDDRDRREDRGREGRREPQRAGSPDRRGAQYDRPPSRGLPPRDPTMEQRLRSERERSEGRGTPPLKGLGGVDRATPDGRGRNTPGHSSSVLADLRQAAKNSLLNRPSSRGPQPEEEGELPREDANDSKRARHSPIVWKPEAKVGASLLDRTQDEVLQFKMMQMGEDDREDSAPLVKSSPSVSGDEDLNELEQAMRAKMLAAQADASGKDRSRRSSDDGSHSDEDAGKPKLGLSRWHDDAAAASPAQPAGRAAANGAEVVPSSSGASPSPSGAGDGSVSPGIGVVKQRYDMRQECRSVDEYERICVISEGTYGVVYKARHKSTGQLVALKRIKMEKEKDGFPVTSLREINILCNFHHPNIVHVSEIVMSPRNQDQIFMVMELADHDLKSLMDDKSQMSQPFSVAQVKNLMMQLLRGVEYLHQNWVLHRDLKTSNILYNNKGELKICDMGLARQYGSPLQAYTHLVVTLWYRAPELLMGTKKYSTAIDMWSVGCIMGELLLGDAICKGQGELDQLDKIISLLGTPTQEEWPGLTKLPNYGKINLPQRPSQLARKFCQGPGGLVNLSQAGFDLLQKMLAYDPEERISAADALAHKWFAEPPYPQKQELMPTFRERPSGDSKRHGHQQKSMFGGNR